MSEKSDTIHGNEKSRRTTMRSVETIAPKKKELTSEKVYRAVKDMIGANRFKAGLRLNVEKLSRELGVSRIPAWEAIRRLEQEGIVRTIPNRGVFMAENPLERILEILETRALDKLSGRLACERINDRVLEQLSSCLRDQLRAIETEGLVLYSSADLKFHGLIYKASGNTYLGEFFESITGQMFPGRLNPLRVLPSVYLTHQEIVEGLANRDPDRVERALTQHAEIVMTHVRAQIQAKAERKELVQRVKKEAPRFYQDLEGTAEIRRGNGAALITDHVGEPNRDILYSSCQAQNAEITISGTGRKRKPRRIS
jgi:DNA-binding GntR family transcriptional regulator